MIHWIIATILVGGTCARDTYQTRNVPANGYRPSPGRQSYFDTELLEIIAREKQNNVVISPLSIKLALGMIMLGASGRTADEIEASLRLPHEDGGKLFREILSSIKGSSSNNNLQIASRIFVPPELKIKQSYRDSLTEVFDSGVTSLSFQDSERANKVLNKWVAEATYGFIPKISESHLVDENTKLVVANAVYFKGKWQTPFLSEKTKRKCFYNYEDACLNANMMSHTGQFDFGYVSKLDAYVINLPYEGKRFSMLLVLPNKKRGHKQLSLDMLHVSLDEILSQLHSQEVHVEIPRFTIKIDTDLIPVLKQLHITDLFGPLANLSNIFENPILSLAVSRILHSAKITVDEEGVESVAVTGSLFVPLMGISFTRFIADRPFLFYIRDNVTGAVLFSGKLEHPEEEEEEEGFKIAAFDLAGKNDPVQAQAHADFDTTMGNAYTVQKPSVKYPIAEQPTLSPTIFSAYNQRRYQDNRNFAEQKRTGPQGYFSAYHQQTQPATGYNPSYYQINSNRMFFRNK